MLRKPATRRKDEDGHTSHCYQLFRDFLANMLAFDTELRFTPAQALQHKFMHEPDPPPHGAAAPLSGSAAAMPTTRRSASAPTTR